MFAELLGHLGTKPPRSLSSLPGLRLTSLLRGGAPLFPFVFLIVFFAVFPLLIVTSLPLARLQFGKSPTADAKLLSIDSNGTCPANGRRVVYIFTATDGLEYRGSGQILGGTPYASASIGDRIPVKYLASNPSVNALRLGDLDEFPLTPFLMFPIFGVMIALLIFVPRLRALLRARSLARNGLITAGRVVFARINDRSVWPFLFSASGGELFVTFNLASGECIESRTPCSNTWLLTHFPPGAPIHVAYRQSKPTKAIVLETFVR